MDFDFVPGELPVKTLQVLLVSFGHVMGTSGHCRKCQGTMPRPYLPFSDLPSSS